MDKRKVLGTIIGSIFFVACMLLMTYAWYSWRSNNTNVNITLEDYNPSLVIDVVSGSLGPVLNYLNSYYYTEANKGKYLSYAEFSFPEVPKYDYYMNAKLNINSISSALIDTSFKYSLVRENSSTGNYDDVVCEGDFSNFKVGSNIACQNVLISANSDLGYRFVVYMDGSMYNSSDMMNGSLSSVLELSVSREATLDTSGANKPYLVDGMIPVYYDEATELWRKADSTNVNSSYKWYDYDSKMWANAVLVSSTNRNTYKSATLGSAVSNSDILAFYVWIPRFKYRVWNITRQAGTEDTYAYSAYTNGIDIVWESSTKTTGNVNCTYNTATVEGVSNLSDTCVYNGTDTITTISGNSNYTDALYTHPAFAFGDSEKTGFWIGKFETTGTASAPTIKPDNTALRSQNISTQFTTSKVFQTYGLSNELDAHMLTNLEWGAVAYLTHSVYGLCDGSSCRDAYINNSSGYYTGRSGGALAGSTDLNLANVYPSDSTSTNKYNTTGYYTYKGYFIDYSGNVTTTKDSSKIASTTGNIYGVYDMSGGTSESVMGNMVNSSNAFNLSRAGSSWNGSSTLDSRYYNAYSYIENYGCNQTNINLSILGDAVAESTGYNCDYCSWAPGNRTLEFNTCSAGVGGTPSWFRRGCDYNISENQVGGSFDFVRFDGSSSSSSSFRSSLS